MSTIELCDARLASSPFGDELLVRCPPWMWFGMGNCLKAVLAPAALECAELMAAADWCAFLRAIREKDDVVSRVQDLLNEAGQAINGATVLVIGVAYKPDVDDMRESPALKIIDLLIKDALKIEKIFKIKITEQRLIEDDIDFSDLTKKTGVYTLGDVVIKKKKK